MRDIFRRLARPMRLHPDSDGVVADTKSGAGYKGKRNETVQFRSLDGFGCDGLVKRFC